MKNKHITQLDEEMIISLVDAYDQCVDFSAAIISAAVPDDAISDARAYWDMLDRQKNFVSTLKPKNTLLDEVLAHPTVFRSGELLQHSAPSPYMKYIIAFAAPVAVAVLVVGAIVRTSHPIQFSSRVQSNHTDTTEISSFVARDMNIVDSPEVTVPAPALAKMSSPVAGAAPEARMMMATFVEDVPLSSDPNQLFAMLQSAGTKESQSDAVVDDVYEARLSELDTIVTSPETLIDAYVQIP